MAATLYKLYFQCHYGKLKSHLVQMVKQSLFEVCVLKLSSFRREGSAACHRLSILVEPGNEELGICLKKSRSPVSSLVSCSMVL